jgi:transcriptional regulator with XRE-family HTH domain
MGGPGSGRRPNLTRWRKAVQLRARGLSLAAIGRQLGLTRQGAAYILANKARRLPAATSRCDDCGREMPQGGTAGSSAGKVYCPDCAARRSGAGFAQRLRSLREARGLSRAALEREAGLRRGIVRAYEEGRRSPEPATLTRLVRVLGRELTGDQTGGAAR